MTDTPASKAALRSTLRQLRQSLSPEQQRSAGRALTHAVARLPRWAKARRIALYHPADGEIDTTDLALMARHLDKVLFLPVLNGDDSLAFARWDSGETQHRNRYNIPEPPDSATRCAVPQLDIIFLPVVGWDESGHRLGMGGGFYDRTLAGARAPLLVGLAHECQRTDGIPSEHWDITMDYVATDRGLYKCRDARVGGDLTR